MILERLEYGKPCTTPDGEVEGGVSPEEYRSLYVSENFPQHKKNRWNLDTVGTNVLYSEEAAVAHIPFVAKEGRRYHWAGITQIHRIRLENQQTKRPYVISRFGAQVSHSSQYGLKQLLHPFQLCATMLDEPVIGFTRNSHIRAFQVVESEPYLEWDEVRKALEYILLGVPIFISLERTEEGLFPSLEEFTFLADAIWAFLPASLRPWFSWGWNVKDFAQSKKPVAGRLMLVASNKCPPNAAEYLGGNEWRDPDVYPDMKKNARRFIQDWLNILEGYEGDQNRISKLSQFFSQASIVKGFGPYAQFVEKPTEIEIKEEQGYQMVLFDQLVGKKQEVLPMLQSVFFTMHSIQKARVWFEGNQKTRLQIQLLRQPVAIAEFHEAVIEFYWRTEKKWSGDKLLQLTWEYLLERARIKQLPASLQLSEEFDLIANFFLKLLLFKQDSNYKSARRGFVKFVKLFRNNSKYVPALRSLIEGRKALESLQEPVYSMLHYIAWPYDKVNKELTLVQLQEIVNIFCLFPEWASDASIRIAVLIEKIREVKNRSQNSFRGAISQEDLSEFEFLENSLLDLLHKTKFPELLKEILEKRPILAAIQERISKPEQIALAAYLWMTKIEKNEEPISVQKRDSSIDWAWTILLGVEIKKVSEVVGNSPFGDWFCLARFGLSAVKEQFPEKFEEGKTSIATRLKLAMATNLPALWPSKEKAFTNIVEAYFTHYEKRLLDYCEPTLQERIFKRFPRYWPWLLAGSPILGTKTEANQHWEAAQISLDEFRLMEKRINSEFEAYQTEDSLFQDNLKEMLQFLWKFIPLVKLRGSKKRGESAKKMLGYLRFLDQAVEKDTDPSLLLLLDNDFSEDHYSFVQNLISHSPNHWKFIRKLWLSYALVPESNRSSHGENVFYLLRTYQKIKYREMPILGSHILNLLKFRREKRIRIFDPLYQQLQDIRSELSKEAEGGKEILLGLDRLEYLILKPSFLRVSKELWDERYRGTLLALCFPKTTKSFPENHFLDWKGFFFEKNSLSREFKLVLKYAQMQKELPIERSLFFSYFNSKMSQDTSDFYAFPRQKVKYGPKSTERFAYLYSNFDRW